MADQAGQGRNIMSRKNTNIIASYADRAGADLLAKFVSARGIRCEVMTAASTGVAAFNVCVPNDLFEAVARLVGFTQIALFDDPTSAEVVAGRLICESVPCCVGGRDTLEHFGFVGGMSGPYTVSVPKRYLTEAKRILEEPPVPEGELTELALRTATYVDEPD
jgi:hypothetical protein